jgi:hypothetical protein
MINSAVSPGNFNGTGQEFETVLQEIRLIFLHIEALITAAYSQFHFRGYC